MAKHSLDDKLKLLLEHARQPTDILLRRIALLEQERDVVLHKYEELKKSFGASFGNIPFEWNLRTTHRIILAALLQQEYCTHETLRHLCIPKNKVSYEASDDLIKGQIALLRKNLREKKVDINIHTKWGIGYYIPYESKREFLAYLELVAANKEKSYEKV